MAMGGIVAQWLVCWILDELARVKTLCFWKRHYSPESMNNKKLKVEGNLQVDQHLIQWEQKYSQSLFVTEPEISNNLKGHLSRLERKCATCASGLYFPVQIIVEFLNNLICDHHFYCRNIYTNQRNIQRLSHKE